MDDFHRLRRTLPLPRCRRRFAAVAIVAALGAIPPTAQAAHGDAYVTQLGGTVAPFNVFTRALGTGIAQPDPAAIAITPDGSTAYVTNYLSDTVVPIDTATDTARAPIPVGVSPMGIAIGPDGSTAYVTASGSDTVTPIDTATNTAGTPIPVGSYPMGVAVAPDGETVYVANTGAGTITPIDTATGIPGTPFAAGVEPGAIAVEPDGSRLWLTDGNTNQVTWIDVASRSIGGSLSAGSMPNAIAISPDGSAVYATSLFSDDVTPIDTATLTAGAAIPVAGAPSKIAITPDGAAAWVTNTVAGSMTPIDTVTATAGPHVAVGPNPYEIAISPAQAPRAAFAASVADGAAATFDASASSHPDDAIASYRWSFGDGSERTTSGPIATHSYAQPGVYTVTLTVADATGCSTDTVFTGQTAYCNGSPAATVQHPVTVAAAQPGDGHARPAGTTQGTTQAIQRFRLSSRCVRPRRDGRARVGLRLRLAKAGPVAVRVQRASRAKPTARCPKANPRRRYDGPLRTVRAIDRQQTRAASVRRRVALSMKLRPGLYRITVRAHQGGGRTTRPARRWVRVLR